MRILTFHTRRTGKVLEKISGIYAREISETRNLLRVECFVLLCHHEISDMFPLLVPKHIIYRISRENSKQFLDKILLQFPVLPKR